MNNFEILGQARLDAAEGQRLMAIAAMRWMRNTATKLIGGVGRHFSAGKTASR